MEDSKSNEVHEQNEENKIEKHPNLSTLSSNETALKISILNNETNTNLIPLGHTNHGFINDELSNHSQKIKTENVTKMEGKGIETGTYEEQPISKNEGTSNEVSKVLGEPSNYSQKIKTESVTEMKGKGTENGTNEEQPMSKNEGTPNEVSKVLEESIENEQVDAKQNDETEHVSIEGNIDTKAETETIKISNQNNFKGKISKIILSILKFAFIEGRDVPLFMNSDLFHETSLIQSKPMLTRN